VTFGAALVAGSAGDVAAQPASTPSSVTATTVPTARCARLEARLPKLEQQLANVNARVVLNEKRLANARSHNRTKVVAAVQHRLSVLHQRHDTLERRVTNIQSICGAATGTGTT
jgi:hypothetical protein